MYFTSIFGSSVDLLARLMWQSAAMASLWSLPDPTARSGLHSLSQADAASAAVKRFEEEGGELRNHGCLRILMATLSCSSSPAFLLCLRKLCSAWLHFPCKAWQASNGALSFGQRNYLGHKDDVFKPLTCQETTAEAATNYAVSTHGQTQPLPQRVPSFCWSANLFLFDRNCNLSTRGPKLGEAWRTWGRRPGFGLLLCREESTHLLGRQTALAHHVSPLSFRNLLWPWISPPEGTGRKGQLKTPTQYQ